MHHYQTNYNILEHAIVFIEYFYEYTLFFRITQGVDVETVYNFFLHHANVFIVEDIFYGIKMVPLTKTGNGFS